LFILFDIEVVFLYPWAVIYREMLASEATAYDFAVDGVVHRDFVRGLHLRFEKACLRLDAIEAASDRRSTVEMVT